MVIVVTVGTHELPFDRLIVGARGLVELGRVRVQRGSSVVEVPGAQEVVEQAPPAVLRRWMAEAQVIITHAGPGSIREALAAGKVPLVVARDPAFGEHIDDHQRHYARFMADRIHWVKDPAELVEAVGAHPRICAARRRPSIAPGPFARAVGDVAEELLQERRGR